MPPRLALAAVGQMATPFQSAWVISNVIWNMKHAGFPCDLIESPILVMKKIAGELFLARDHLLQPTKKTELMMRLEMAVDLWGRPDAGDIICHHFNAIKTQVQGTPTHVLRSASVPGNEDRSNADPSTRSEHPPENPRVHQPNEGCKLPSPPSEQSNCTARPGLHPVGPWTCASVHSNCTARPGLHPVGLPPCASEHPKCTAKHPLQQPSDHAIGQDSEHPPESPGVHKPNEGCQLPSPPSEQSNCTARPGLHPVGPQTCASVHSTARPGLHPVGLPPYASEHPKYTAKHPLQQPSDHAIGQDMYRATVAQPDSTSQGELFKAMPLPSKSSGTHEGALPSHVQETRNHEAGATMQPLPHPSLLGHAMPLPRLGCGGPSQVGVAVQSQDHGPGLFETGSLFPHQRIAPEIDSSTTIPPIQAMPTFSGADLTHRPGGHPPSFVHSVFPEQPSPFRHAHEAIAGDLGQDQRIQADPEMSRQTKMVRKHHNVLQSHNPPILGHAMPLPRLRCGGPSPDEKVDSQQDDFRMINPERAASPSCFTQTSAKECFVPQPDSKWQNTRFTQVGYPKQDQHVLPTQPKPNENGGVEAKVEGNEKMNDVSSQFSPTPCNAPSTTRVWGPLPDDERKWWHLCKPWHRRRKSKSHEPEDPGNSQCRKKLQQSNPETIKQDPSTYPNQPMPNPCNAPSTLRVWGPLPKTWCWKD